MPLNKVHKRKVAANLPRQLLGGTTTTTHATSASSAVHSVQNPTGPPLFISTTSTGAGAGATTTSTTGGATTTGSTTSSQTTTSTNTVAATSAAGGAAQVTSAAATSAAHTSASRTVTRAVTASTSSTASPTSTGTGDDGMSLGSIAGAAGAAVIGIGIIAAFVVWFIRRKKKNSDPDEEPFNRNSFLRQSTIIPDDGPVPTRTRATPAPNMIERQPSPMYGSTHAFDAGQNAFGYNTQPSYSTGQLYAPNAMNPFGPGGAPATPLPPSPGFGTAYEQPGYNNGGYSELTRGSVVQDFPPSPNAHGPMSPPLENPHSPNYPGPETFPAHSHENMPSFDDHSNGAAPVSGMYVQPGFPELTPATASAQHGQVVAVTSSVHDGRETPVQLGFAPVQTPNANQPTGQAAAGQGANGKRRPDTMYDDDDAYGGI